MKKRVIVTGANGYLGLYVCQELIERNYSVIGLKYKHFTSRIIESNDIKYINADISKNLLDNEALSNEIDKAPVLAIVNLAALLGSSDYDENYKVNAQGVKNLLDLAVQKGIGRFIQISSVVVLKKLKGPYGETKLLGQQFVEKSSLDYTVFIPAMIMGPESLGLNRVLKNVFRIPLIVPLIGWGKQTQHPIFVKDFARYIVLSIENKTSHNKTYEIAGDTVIPFRDFILKILKIKNKSKILLPIPVIVAHWLGLIFEKTQKIPLFTSEHVKGVLQSSYLNTEKIKKDLDFIPTPFDQALEFCINKINNNWNYYMRRREEEVILPQDNNGN
jgi:NADH dehydrogenase